jgi:RNA polymerase sigma-70 factor (ECF subfamily)
MAHRLTHEQIERARRLIWPHLEVALRVAGHITRNPHDAEDLVQESVMKAMRFIDRLADGTDPRSWLLTIVRRTHIDRCRSARLRATVSLDAAPQLADQHAHQPTPLDDAEQEVWREPERLMERLGDEQIIDALAQLPDEIRWTLLLVDVEQLDHADAAAVLEVPVGTIKSRAHRGRKMLRDALAPLARQKGWVTEQEPTP